MVKIFYNTNIDLAGSLLLQLTGIGEISAILGVAFSKWGLESEIANIARTGRIISIFAIVLLLISFFFCGIALLLSDL